MKLWIVIGINTITFSAIFRTIMQPSDNLQNRLKIPILVRKFIVKYFFEIKLFGYRRLR